MDIHPASFFSSYAWGTNGTQQVGWGLVSVGDSNYIRHALLWNGTADSAVDLAQFLPHDWVNSRATDVAPDGTITILAGYSGLETHIGVLVPDGSQPQPCRIASISLDTQQIDVSQACIDTPLIFPHPVTGTVTLTAPAPSGGAPVTVYNLQTPWNTVTVTVPEGQTSASFEASDARLVYELDMIISQTLLAYYGGDQKFTGYITTGPFEQWPGAVRQGIVGFLQLKYPAKADEWVTVGSDNPAIIQVPSKVFLRKGDNVVNYPLDIVPPVQNTLVGVVAVCNEGTAAGVMNVIGNPLPTAQPTTLTPSTVVAGQPFALTVTGSQMMLGATIVVNGVSLSSHFVDSFTLTANVPGSATASGGSISVQVVNPHALPSTSLILTAVGPTLKGLSPGTALAGQRVTLTLKGTDFADGAQAFVGGVAVPTTFVSSLQLTASVPGSLLPSAGQMPVWVQNPGTRLLSTQVMLNLNNPTPTITSLSPATVAVGSAAFSLTIVGTNFVSTSAAQWSGKPLPTTYVSSTQIQVAIPATNLVKSGNFTLTVQNPSPGGGGSNGVNLVVK